MHSRKKNIRERKTPSKNDKYHTFGLTIYYEVDKPKNEKKNKKNIKKMGKKQKKKHKNVWITFAFVFQRRKTNVILDEHEFYVLCEPHAWLQPSE